MSTKRSINAVSVAALIVGGAGAATAQTTPAQTPAASATTPVVEQEAAVEGPRLFQLEVPVVYDQTPISTIFARVAQTGEFEASREDILKLLAGVVTEEALEDITAALGDIETVTNEEAKQAGFELVFDPQIVALRLTTAPDARQTNNIALSRQSDFSAAFERSPQPSPVSAFFNLTAGGQVDTNPGAENEVSAVLGIDGAIRAADFVLRGTAFYDGNNDQLEVGRLQLIRDFIDFDVRATLGDISTTGGDLVGGEQIIGLSLAHREGQFGRGSVVSSATTEAFDIDKSSNVEILVNGELRRRVRLAPGRYTLSEFNLISGANEILIVATDDAGVRSETLITAFSDGALARPGSFEWELSAGFLTDTDLADFDFDTEDPVVAGRFTYGATEFLTLSAAGLARDDGQIGSISADIATPIGFIGVDGAVSRAETLTGDSYGAAVNAVWSPVLPEGLAKEGRSLSLSAFYSTDNFSSIASDSNADARLRFAGRLSEAFEVGDTPVRGSLFGSYETARDRNDPDQYTIGSSFSFVFGPEIAVTVSPRYERDFNGDDEFAAFISLSKIFNDNFSGAASYDTEDNRAIASVGYTNQLSGVGGLRAGASVATSDLDETSVNASVAYTANRAIIAANHFQEITENGQNDDLGSVSNVTVSTAIVFAGGEFGISQPVSDSFAILKKHPTLGDAKVTVNPGRDNVGDGMRDDGFGNLVATSVPSYSPATILYDVDGAPIGYDSGPGAFELAGPLNAGYLLEVGSERAVSAIGTLLTSSGAPAEYLSGTITSTDDLEFEAQKFFTNRAGRYIVQGMLPGRTYVLSLRGADDITFSTTPDSYKINELGERTTTLP